MAAPIPRNELDRIATLKRYEVLDTPPEEIFDWITGAVAERLGVPIAYISLLDETRQWFKSRHGLLIDQTPREIAFCAHGIVGEAPFQVSDALQDPRFADNPLVVDEPHIRFYCGVPLRTHDHFNLGTLAVMDFKPRQLSPEQIATQQELANLVVRVLDLRLAARRSVETEFAARKVAEHISQERLEMLRKSEALKSTILQSALDAIVSVDGAGNILEWNNAAEKIFGHGRSEVIGKPFAELIIPPDLRHDHQAGFERYIQTGRLAKPGRVLDLTALRADGSEFPVEIAVTSENCTSDHVITAFIRDVTAKKRSEEQLRQSQKMEAVGQLTGGLAHDFNNLLAIIGGNAELAAQGIGDRAQHLQVIVETAERGAQLTQQLLAFSRRQALSPIPLRVDELVEHLLVLLRRTLGEAIEISLYGDEDLWLTEIDAGQLEAALLNLVINARDAMPDGGKLTIKVANATLDEEPGTALSGAPSGQYVSISVGDTGIGMPQENVKKAFEPFFTTKKAGRGTGLGLSMVYGFITQSGGGLDIDSVEGEGTTVRLFLPRYQGQEPRRPKPIVKSEPLKGQGETVLVVEDEEALRELVGKLLRSLGYEVLEASEGQSALEKLAGHPETQLLLTDLMLPGGISGTDLAAQACSHCPGLRVLFMSGHGGKGGPFSDQLNADAALLQKPFRRADIARVVREVLDREKV